uniref:Uncharacterized protein n=1 Tax=Arundo donax TaxID=35708 RepID=A0A0A9AI80_ARUDO
MQIHRLGPRVGWKLPRRCRSRGRRRP